MTIQYGVMTKHYNEVLVYDQYIYNIYRVGAKFQRPPKRVATQDFFSHIESLDNSKHFGTKKNMV